MLEIAFLSAGLFVYKWISQLLKDLTYFKAHTLIDHMYQPPALGKEFNIRLYFMSHLEWIPDQWQERLEK